MKINMDILKYLSRLIVLLIFFVLLFLITCFLYSVRYWPDVYNYVNANITITYIPTINELNIPVIKAEEVDVTTESYYTTENFGYTDETTDTFEEKEEKYDADAFDYFFNERSKRNVAIEVDKDFSEVPTQVVVDYVFLDKYTVDASDSVTDQTNSATVETLEDEKITVRDMGDVEMVNCTFVTGETHLETGASLSEAIFPWIATIFVKNGSNNQFDYYCDGAIITIRNVLTSARCVTAANSTHAGDFITIVGKRSLQATGEGETAHRVKQIIIHDMFSANENGTKNDLAVLVLEDDLVFNNDTKAVSLCSGDEGTDVHDAFTTGWDFVGNLTAIRLKDDQNCKGISPEAFCTAFGNNVAVCPSHGGIYAAKQKDGQFCLKGLRSSDTTARGLCVDRNVLYTDIVKAYKDWLGLGWYWYSNKFLGPI